MDITRKKYEKNYDDRLSFYKNQYVDNTPKSFLEIELNSYNKYYNSLKKISHFTKTSPKNNLGLFPITSEVGWELKIINEQVYKEIITTKKDKQEEDDFEQLLYPGERSPSIEINTDNLNNRILSAKRILDCIYEKIEDSENSSNLEKPKDIDMSESDRDKHEDLTDMDENDYTKSTIEDYLYNIKNHMYRDQYETLVDALHSYFTTGQFTKLKKKIMFKRVNKKKVGWALKEVYNNLKTDKLSVEYFEFAKENINLFEKEQIESENFHQSKFYKYFTTNPYK